MQRRVLVRNIFEEIGKEGDKDGKNEDNIGAEFESDLDSDDYSIGDRNAGADTTEGNTNPQDNTEASKSCQGDIYYHSEDEEIKVQLGKDAKKKVHRATVSMLGLEDIFIIAN
eukprot:7327943-Ditylum_brightwellii.AAC.1